MHLKGEKELKAEKVYSLLEAEYSKEFDKYADKCKSLNIKDVENIMSENRRQLVMFNALQVIYNMELTDSDVKYAIDPYTMKEIDLDGVITMKPYELYLVCLKNKN